MNNAESLSLQSFQLHTFLTRNPPCVNEKRKYVHIIAEQAKQNTNLGTAYSEQWPDIIKNTPDVKILLDKYVHNSVLLDLGCGRNVEFANVQLTPAEYIAVDRFITIEPVSLDNALEPGNFPSERRRRNINRVNIKRSEAAERALILEVLRMQESNNEPDTTSSLHQSHAPSVSEIQPGEPVITLVKADMLDFLEYVPDNSSCIVINGIDYTLGITTEYHQALAAEMARACKPGGIVFGVTSDSLTIVKNHPDFIVLQEDTKRGWFILQKRMIQTIEMCATAVRSVIADAI